MGSHLWTPGLQLVALLGMSTWPPAGGTVWEGPGTFGRWSLAGGSASLEMGLRVCNLVSSSLCFVFVVGDVISQSLTLAAGCHASSGPLWALFSSWKSKPKQILFSLSCLWPWCFVREQQKVNTLTNSWYLTVPSLAQRAPFNLAQQAPYLTIHCLLSCSLGLDAGRELPDWGLVPGDSQCSVDPGFKSFRNMCRA